MRRSRLIVAFVILLIVIHAGAFGYYLQFSGTVHDRTFAECLYRTTLLVTTVNEPFPEVPQDMGLKRYTIVLLISGMGIVLYVVSTFAAFIIELDLRRGAQTRRRRKMIDELRDHVIVCGGGETGQVICRELQRHGVPFVVLERDPQRVADLRARSPEIYVLQADATQDDSLRNAGIERAQGVISSLHGDTENLFVVITARQLNPRAKIVARSIHPSTDAKLTRAGAHTVVSPNTIGADRMVSAMVRPHVVTFLDRLLRDPQSTHRIEEVEVRAGSSLEGSTIAGSQIATRTKLLVLALRAPGEPVVCNPPASTPLVAGTLLVVLGERDGYERLVELAGGAAPQTV